MEDIRKEVSELLVDIDKSTVNGGEENVRICFSVDEAGVITVFSVLSASPDLKAEIIETMHHTILEAGSTEGEAVWLTTTILANK